MAVSKPVSWQDELKDELTCTVCMELYNHSDKLPKQLPCGHTFCLVCIIQYADKHLDGLFLCPLCNKQITLCPDDVDDLPNNLS